MKRSSRAAANSALKRAQQRQFSSGLHIANPLLNGDHKWAHYLKNLRQSVVSQVFAILVAVASVIALGWTLWSINGDLQFRAEERKNWRLDRIERAWTRVLRYATGNTAKGKALGYLHSQGEELIDIDLSCKKMGGMAGEKCIHPVTITDLIFKKDPQPFPSLIGEIFPDNRFDGNVIVDFSDVNIKRFFVSNEFVNMNMNNSESINVLFKNSKIIIRGKRSKVFIRTYIYNSNIEIFGKIYFEGSYFEKVFFKFRDYKDIKFGPNVYFSALHPPKCRITDRTGDPFSRSYKICPFVTNWERELCAKITNSQERLLLNNFPIVRNSKFQDTIAKDAGCRNFSTQVGKNHDAMLDKSLTVKQASFLYPNIYYGRWHPHP